MTQEKSIEEKENEIDVPVNQKIIHPKLEPGVINETMIVEVVLEGYKGEAGRLARMEPIDLSNVTTLRLEFLSK